MKSTIALLIIGQLFVAIQLTAAETNVISPVSTNVPLSVSSTSAPVIAPGTVPRLQRRSRPDVSPESALNREGSLEKSRGGWGTNTPANRVSIPGYSRMTNQFTRGPHNVPPGLLRRYDRDRNGVLDPSEWARYRNDQPMRRSPETGAAAQSGKTNNAGLK